MVTPRWVEVLAQPIAIDDVLALPRRGARRSTAPRAAIFEIGGADAGLVRRAHARVRAPARTAPLDDPGAGADAAALEPLARARDAALRRVGRKLIDSIRHPTVVHDARGAARLRDPPDRRARGDRAGARATRTGSCAETRWSDALSAAGQRTRWGGRTLRQPPRRLARVARRRRRRRRPSRRSAGSAARRGWYCARRGSGGCAAASICSSAASACAAGGGTPSGCASATPLDFWRVEAIEPGRRLRLRAEMKLPGRAWLPFKAWGAALARLRERSRVAAWREAFGFGGQVGLLLLLVVLAQLGLAGAGPQLYWIAVAIVATLPVLVALALAFVAEPLPTEGEEPTLRSRRRPPTRGIEPGLRADGRRRAPVRLGRGRAGTSHRLVLTHVFARATCSR